MCDSCQRRMTATKPEDYKAVYLWHRNTGSYPYYIEQQQEKAFAAKAPVDAIYHRYGTENIGANWRTVSDLHEGHEFREQYNTYLKEQGE